MNEQLSWEPVTLHWEAAGSWGRMSPHTVGRGWAKENSLIEEREMSH